jgi:hypothetical protein
MSLEDFVEDMRHEVIDDAVAIEHVISYYLAEALNIEQIENDKKKLPLHYLDFIEKGQILREMKVVTHDQFVKVQIFAEIRNVFAHNLSIETLSEYFKTYPDRETKLFKFYPQEKLTPFDKEIKQYNIYLRLVNELKLIDFIRRLNHE